MYIFYACILLCLYNNQCVDLTNVYTNGVIFGLVIRYQNRCV
jgi:hypothetical protein